MWYSSKLNWLIGILLTSGIAIVGYTIYLINSESPTDAAALAPIGIILASFIASASVMKSIVNQNEIERQKEKRELFKQRFEIYDFISNFLLEALQSQNINYRNTIDLRRKTITLTWLYPVTFEKIVDRIIEHYVKLEGLNKKIEGLDKVIANLDKTLDKSELRMEKAMKEREVKLNEASTELEWFKDEFLNLSEAFKPYLDLNNNIK